MNAAARLVHQRVLSRHLFLSYFLTRQQAVLALLACCVLISALSVIYITHVTRILHASYQHSVAEHNQLYIERGQLLLERGTQMMQTHVQQAAEHELGMVLPDHQSVVIIHE